MEPLFYDTETYSILNIKKAGGDKYARHFSTECTIISWGFSHGPCYVHDFRQDGPIPQELEAALKNPKYMKIAFNAPFDRAILRHTLGIEIPWSECMDAMTLANSLGFTGDMGKIQEAIGMNPDDAKMKEGKKLIQLFCKPAPKKHHADRYDHTNKAEEWAKFVEYGLQDTSSMRMMWNWLMAYNPMDDLEWGYWRMTQEMNQRGIPVDIALVHNAMAMAADRKKVIKAEMTEMTKLDNPNSTQQILPWLAERGTYLPNMQAATLDAYANTLPVGEVRNFIAKKRIFSMTAVKKWDSFEAMAVDGVIRGTITFRGASRTGRDASRGINLQNMSRPPKGDMDVLVQPIYNGGNDAIQMLYGEPLMFLAKTVRGAIKAPTGYRLAVSDLGSIESRCLGWLAGCKRMMNIFAQGKDTYKDFATELFNVPYDHVSKDQRTFSKPPVLGCFTKDTKVFTDIGWVDIIRITNRSRIWDGVQWVTSDGVKFQGVQRVETFLGVTATHDHPILVADKSWIPWGEVTDANTLQEMLSVSGHFSNMTDSFGSVDAPAGLLAGYTPPTSTPVSQALAYLVQTLKEHRRTQSQQSWASLRQTSTDWLTGFMHKDEDAQAGMILSILTMAEEALPAILLLQKMQLNITLLSLVGITPTKKLIELIMVETMRLEILGSSPEASSVTTPELTELSCMEGLSTLLSISGENLPQDTEIKAPLPGKSVKDYLLNRLFQTRSTAEAPTYDIVNCGENSRFTIWSDAGPIIVHNSGYMMGATGLRAYADKMGVNMTEEESAHATRVFRESYPEITRLWKWLIRVIQSVLMGGGPAYGYQLTIYKDRDFMFIVLPSGRSIAYHQAAWQNHDTPIGNVPSFTYMGINRKNMKWERIAAHAGGVTENIIQAIARDILMVWVERLPDLDIRLRVHDELVAVVHELFAESELDRMNTVIAQPIDWAPGLLLTAEGEVVEHYGK